MAKSHLRLLSSSSESEDSCDEDQDGASMNPRRGISDDSEDSEDEMDCNEEEDEIFQDPGSDVMQIYFNAGDASCAICLNEFTKQKVGVPNNCRHIFCVDCILEWSKNANSCPVDRIEFEAIQVYRRFGGVFVHELVVEKKINVVETHENDTNCQVCGSGENEETLLLCDGCDLGYHCACLNPPLEQVPSDEWFCINCRPSHAAGRFIGTKPGVVSLSSMFCAPKSRVYTNLLRHRVIGRTLASERVRSDITRSRLRHSALVSSLDEQIDSIVTEILSNSGHRLRISNSSARRPRSSSRRSTSRKKRTGSKKRRSTSKKRTSKRRKTKRGRKTNKTPRHPMSNRVFGGRCDNNAGNSTTNDITNGTFSIMGGADDLDEYMQSRSDEGDPSYITAQKHRMLSLSAIRFNVPLPSLLSASSTRGMDRYYHHRVSRPPPTPDLLGSILQSQEVLLAPTTNIQIQSGGKILLK
uniref:Zinc finger protein n=1 Tax=Ciona intestinalis TaxID=7719 RepID=F6PH84_CIOIN